MKKIAIEKSAMCA